MLGYLAAAAVCLAAVLVLRTDPWSFPEVPGLSSIFPEQCKAPFRRASVSLWTCSREPGLNSQAKDASRAYVTGDFTDAGLVDDVSELSPTQMLHLNNWLSFYQKNYLAVGKLIGHFYDEDGDPTKALEDALTVIDVGLKLKEQRHEENKQFPPCNSEFSSGASKVWCSKNSGGIKRDWVGVPRKLYLAGYDGYRCVCVRTNGPPSENPDSKEHHDRGDLDNASLKEYKDCNPLFDWCWLKE
ncbi:neuferricin isoform X2 [Bufo bufo]|uniref:neuferricin isoform X2 n=1 Tax=Bufo bufo TaxID=8384 RepID=UPI001ABECA37|nr:neuferricin isoform X2 [Bufo bufo]